MGERTFLKGKKVATSRPQGKVEKSDEVLAVCGRMRLKNSTQPSMPSFSSPSLEWRINARRK